MASPTQGLQSPLSSVEQSSQVGTNGLATPADGTNAPSSSDDLNSVDNLPDTIQSPTESHLHSLPAKPASQLSSQVAPPNPAISTQNQPRIVGGFEVDDDAEEKDGSPDEKDELDVYDPSVGLDFDVPTPAPAVSLDRTSQSPEQENGITPAPVQASGSPADISSSALPFGADANAPRAATPTPAQSTALDPSAQPSPPRLNVNGSVAPAVSKSRLAHDVVGILEDRIKDDPRGDTAAYLDLIEELKSRNKQDDARRIYDQYLSVFPLAVGAWLYTSHSTWLILLGRSMVCLREVRRRT